MPSEAGPISSTPAVKRRTSDRALMYARAAAFAVIAAFAISVLGSSGSDSVSGRLGGDFPAFYAAGSIAADGDWAELYDPDRQLLAQQDLLGSEVDGYLYFAYPPHAAAAYQPFSALDYRVAYTLHSLLMAAAVIAALALIKPMVAYVRRNFELVAIGSLLFYPLLRSVTGGQNTALSLLALAAVWRLLHDDQEVAAGLVLALLMFKPQFAIPLIGLMVLTRRWRAFAAAAAGSAVLWLASAGLMGVNWVSVWWTEVADFASIDAEVNGHNAISWLGVAEHLFGPGSTGAIVLAAPAMLASIGAIVWAWVKPDLGLDVRMAATALALILISPHAMFYDAGLLVLAALVLLDRVGSDAYLPIAICWVGAWLHLFASSADFSILFVVMVLAAVVAARQLWVNRGVGQRGRTTSHDGSCSPTPQIRPITQ